MKLELPEDKLGFVRRRCPSCSREYKTHRTDEDAAVCLAVVAQKLRHANEDELSPYVPGPRCIYCGVVPAAIEQLTAAQRQYLERVAEQLGEEVRYERLRHVPQPTFITVRPGPAVARLREPDDFHRISFLCCGEEAKSDCPASASLHCPRCGAVQQVGRPRANVSGLVLDA